MEGGGTLSEIYQNSKRLSMRVRGGLERLEQLEFSSPSSIDSPELSSIKRDISQIHSLCVEMDRLWRSIDSKPQRDLWKRKKAIHSATSTEQQLSARYFFLYHGFDLVFSWKGTISNEPI